VVDELRRGYFLHDRLLRPAMVRVALPDDSPMSDDGGD
jgi:molecular chaperone GrpE (heat shock protein)